MRREPAYRYLLLAISARRADIETVAAACDSLPASIGKRSRIRVGFFISGVVGLPPCSSIYESL